VAAAWTGRHRIEGSIRILRRKVTLKRGGTFRLSPGLPRPSIAPHLSETKQSAPWMRLLHIGDKRTKSGQVAQKLVVDSNWAVAGATNSTPNTQSANSSPIK
jgi:hypothetical protein